VERRRSTIDVFEERLGPFENPIRADKLCGDIGTPPGNSIHRVYFPVSIWRLSQRLSSAAFPHRISTLHRIHSRNKHREDISFL
jgi:hypothetical protein